MKQLTARGIILSRTDYGEADRIITVLTPAAGKLRLMARGVRRQKSKLAGGIELFSTSDLVYVQGRGELGTLISSRLLKHYGQIVRDIQRVQLGYDLIKLLNRATEDNPEAAYYELLERGFQALEDTAIDPALIRPWFEAQLLSLGGHMPDMLHDSSGQPLSEQANYNFDFEQMAFATHEQGKFTANHIKAARLLFGGNQPAVIARIDGLGSLLSDLAPLIRASLTNHVRI